MSIKHVQFRDLVKLNLDGSMDGVMGVMATAVESLEWTAKGSVLVIVLKRNRGTVNVPLGNIACWEDYSELELAALAQAEITKQAAAISAAKGLTEQRQAQAEAILNPTAPRRRTINDM